MGDSPKSELRHQSTKAVAMIDVATALGNHLTLIIQVCLKFKLAFRGLNKALR